MSVRLRPIFESFFAQWDVNFFVATAGWVDQLNFPILIRCIRAINSENLNVGPYNHFATAVYLLHPNSSSNEQEKMLVGGDFNVFCLG